MWERCSGQGWKFHNSLDYGRLMSLPVFSARLININRPFDFMKLTLLDETMQNYGDGKPVKVTNPDDNAPIAVDDYIAQRRANYEPVNENLSVLDAAMGGYAFNVKLNNGELWEINKGQPKANLAGIETSLGNQDANLEYVVQSVINNMPTFSVYDCVAWGKVAFAHYEPEKIRAYAERRLKELCESNKLTLINHFEGTYSVVPSKQISKTTN